MPRPYYAQIRAAARLLLPSHGSGKVIQFSARGRVALPGSAGVSAGRPPSPACRQDERPGVERPPPRNDDGHNSAPLRGPGDPAGLGAGAGYGAIGTGLPLITCKLSQNGQTFYGSGISYSGYLIFCMSNSVFQCQAPGKGSYHLAGSPKYQTEFTLSPYSPKM
jgi:hypothetical protein